MNATPHEHSATSREVDPESVNAVLGRWAEGMADRYAAFYRDLHAHPELSGHEHRTAAAVATALHALDGIHVTPGVAGTGVVAVLENGDGPVVMMRADMDALPMAEATGLPYASTDHGIDADGRLVPVAHACGHDVHTTALVAAVHLLSAARAQWSGTVVAVFQPAEELLTGAADMIADGLFERFPRPGIVLGQHVGASEAGTVRYALGPAMAGNDSAKVTLYGRGGHAGWPEHTVDPLVMAAAAVLRLQTVVAREVPSTEQAVLTVGTLHAGTKDNIIADTSVMGITLRSYTPATRTLLRAATERIVRAEAHASSAPRDPDIDWYQGAPALTNDTAAMTTTVEAFRTHLGAGNVTEAAPIAASEDVGAYGAALSIPTVYWWLGGTDPHDFADAQRTGEALPFNHSPRFAPVIEPTISTGVKALAVAALTWLGAPRPT